MKIEQEIYYKTRKLSACLRFWYGAKIRNYWWKDKNGTVIAYTIYNIDSEAYLVKETCLKTALIKIESMLTLLEYLPKPEESYHKRNKT